MTECPHCKTPLPDDMKYCGSCGAQVSDPGSLGGASLGEEAMLVRLQRAVEGRYEIKKPLGRGGMAMVYLADDLELERPVAIKVLLLDLSLEESFVTRFQREARTSAKLDHPNIIPIYAVESSEDIQYFVMKWIDGDSLDQILKTRELSLEGSRRIIGEAASALGHAHQRGVVHRDVKPANMMIDQHERTILTDFGISKALESATQITATGQLVGTPNYMSPEQAKGIPVDGRSDQYSLGVVAYRLLTGRLPFADAPAHIIIYQHISEPHTPMQEIRPELPDPLVAAIDKALSKAPDDRFRTMEEMAAAVLGTGAEASTRSGRHALPRGGKQAPWKRWAIPVAGTLVVGSVITIVVNRPDGEAEPAPSGLAAAAADSGALGSAADPTDDQNEQTPPLQQPAPSTAQLSPPTQTQPTPQQQPTVQRPAAPTVGFLTINATPFGTVSIDGVDVGDTPLVRHELPPGQHVVTISRAGYQALVDTIVVTAGNEIRRQKTLVRQDE